MINRQLAMQQSAATTLSNWAGNIQYGSSILQKPSGKEELIAMVKKADKLKVLGSRHCFNHIADSRHGFISLQHLNRIVSLDERARTVTIEGGMNYGQLCPLLQEKGFALHNLASLPHISVAGACATATHGSGVNNGNLATAVQSVEFVTANGNTVTLHREQDADSFHALLVGLGAFGVITELTLQIEPSYTMRQDVFEQLPMRTLAENFDAIAVAGYSVSLFTDWQSDYINEVWIKSRLTADTSVHFSGGFFDAIPAKRQLHPIAHMPAENCTEQMGKPGYWFERLPHFKMGFTPSSGVELQSEYFVPREHAVAAIQAIARLGKQIGPYLLVSEIRTIDKDEAWMSPCYRQPSVALHFTWQQNWAAVKELLPLIETALLPFNVKPHWGKLFTMSPESLAAGYEKLPAFAALVKTYDTGGKFRNDFLDRYIFNAS
ncbi:MAG TPA: FAD-binding protein [Chitinophagaceae bacterium]|nr:FAD-binding protein [Chitinophagaceae bacterium]